MSKNPKSNTEAAAGAIGAIDSATDVADPAAAAAAAQAAAQFAGQAQAATERIQQAVQDLAVQLSQSARDTQDLLAQAKLLMGEAIESHNAVVATLESAAMDGAVGLTAAEPAVDPAPALSAMTVAEAARLVRRRKVVEAAGAQPRVIESAISPDEVLAFTDHGTHVVVVTVDGQKFSTADAA